MPRDPLKPNRFFLTPADRAAFDPETGIDADIGLWSKLYFDTELFPWQRYFWHAPQKDRMVIAGIRSGKSFSAAVGLLHFMFYHPHSRVLNTSISSEQAKIVYQSMLELCTQDRFKHWVAKIEKSPYPRIELVNGSEAWFRSIGYNAELIRGFEFDVINIDECGYVQSANSIDTLKGRLMGFNKRTNQHRYGLFTQMSSPKGKIGWVYARWQQGDPRYQNARPDRFLSLRARTLDNPKISESMLQDIMADYSEKQILQELMGEFIDADQTEFSLEQIAYCHSMEHPEVRWILDGIERARAAEEAQHASVRLGLKRDLGLSEDLDHYDLPAQPGHQYLASWDLGKQTAKSGRNATVGMVWDITELPWKLVGFHYDNRGRGYVPAMADIETVHFRYAQRAATCHTLIDATGKGDVINELMQLEHRIPVEGITYSAQLKPNLIASAKIAVERGMVRFPFIKRFVDELAAYQADDKKLAQDTVMAFAQAMHRARELTGVATDRPMGIQLLNTRRDPTPMIGTASEAQRRFLERRRASFSQRSGRA